MLTKLSTFRGVSDRGEPLNRVFHKGDSIQKLAGSMMPEIQEWLRGYTPNKKEIVVLVNALGASEFWGQNSNGDRFSWDSLSHCCDDHVGVYHPIDTFTGKPVPPYGYRTFLDAHPFAHHRNKDPNRSFGSVALSVLNRKMRRIELVVIVDRAKALNFGAQHIVDRIDSGDYPDVSMGTKVPYDVCALCGNKSKTRHDYCSCIKNIGMGKILSDGRQIGVWNPHPKFFDISFVFIGADKTAKMMMKLAHADSGLWVPESVLEGEWLYGSESDGLVKAAEALTLPGKVVERASQLLTGAGLPQYQAIQSSADDKGRGHIKVEKVGPEGASKEVYRVSSKGIEKSARVSKAVSKAVKAVKRNAPKVYETVSPRIPDAVGVYSRSQKEKKASVEIGPPPIPNRKEYPFVGTIDFKGLRIHVENKAGDVRSGTGPEGKKWSTKMLYPYGEIVGTRGVDKDKLDVYVGPDSDSDTVFIVHQNFPGNHPTKAGKYDEDKVMLGFNTPEEAEKAYRAHYNRRDFFRSMTIMPLESFKKSIMGELKGEKVAGLNKVAEDLKLEDLFNCHENAVRRQRIWKDMETGKSTYHVGSGLGDSFSNMQKTASVESLKFAAKKMADQKKWAEIKKEIDPEGNIGRVVAVLSDHEPNIPTEQLNDLGQNHSLEEALSTLSGMGMVAKPEEFQRILLAKIGRTDIADALDKEHTTFAPVDDEAAPCSELGPDSFSSELMQRLLPLIEGKSYFGPPVRKRIMIVIRVSKPQGEPSKEVSNPLLTKVSAAYNWYRKQMLKTACSAESLISAHPELGAAVYGVRDIDLFYEKTSSVGLPELAAVSAVPLVMMHSAHMRNKAINEGYPVTGVNRFVANHPIFSSMLAAGAVREGGRGLQGILK